MWCGCAEVLKTEDASIGEVVEANRMQELPSERADAAGSRADGPRLAPGPRRANRRHESAVLAAGAAHPRITIGGNRPNANYFLVDGVTNTDPTFNTQNISLSPDAVQEFQVQTGSYSAEMGGAGGGQINIVTRVGHQPDSTAQCTNFCATRRWTHAASTKWAATAIWCRTISERSLGGPLYRQEDFLLRQLRRAADDARP